MPSVIVEVLTKPRELALPKGHELVHRGEHFFHLTYVGVEAVYQFEHALGKIACCLFVCGILSFFVKAPDSEPIYVEDLS